jgi:hypothetical protein
MVSFKKKKNKQLNKPLKQPRERIWVFLKIGVK